MTTQLQLLNIIIIIIIITSVLRYTYIAQLVSSLSALFARDPCKPHLTSTLCPI